MSQNRYKWGIDLGGTKIEAVILDADKDDQIVERLRVPTLSDQGYVTVTSQIKKLVKMMEDASGLKPSRIGIGTPGRLDPISKTIKNSNSICLNGQPLLADLENIFGIECRIENDANCFAISEAKHLLKSDYPHAEVIFGIILGTGVGGGIVVNGEILSGKHGIGGEWGHNFLDTSGGDCYCGRVGCVETLISGPALEKYYSTLSGKKSKLKDIVSIHQAVQDPHATATVERLHYFFGKSMAQLINILDPEVVVIGGGVGNIDSLYTDGVDAVRQFLFNDKLATEFVKPRFGDSSGVLGAAYL